MTIYTGLTTDSSPDGAFVCAPKGGIFLSFAADDASIYSATYTSMSVCFIDSGGDNAGVVIGASSAGFDFTNTGTVALATNILAAYRLTASDTPVEMAEITGLTGGWDLVTTGSSAGYRVLYQALFGDTMETAVGYFTLTSSGDVSVTGLPFQPDLVIVAGADGSENGVMNIGAIDAAANQFSTAVGIGRINDPDTHKNWFRHMSTALCQCPATSGNTGADEWEYTGAITSDGFDLTALTNPSGDRVYAYLAVYDPSGGFAVGTIDSDTDITGLTFEPEAYLVTTCFTPDDADYDDGTIYGLGALMFPAVADNPLVAGVNGAGGGIGHNGQELQNPCQVWRYATDSTIAALQRYDNTSTLDTQVDFVATADGFTSDTSTGSSVTVGWIAMRGSTQSSCPWEFRFAPQIIRY